MTVPAAYAYPIPDEFSDTEAAPLLCAGAIGHRALKLCTLRDGELLGLTGFGGSAHLVIQQVRHQFPHSEVCVSLATGNLVSLPGNWGPSGQVTLPIAPRCHSEQSSTQPPHGDRLSRPSRTLLREAVW